MTIGLFGLRTSLAFISEPDEVEGTIRTKTDGPSPPPSGPSSDSGLDCNHDAKNLGRVPITLTSDAP